tara:strand:- start:54 stop:173 length:120 start_codon:yes stop_codon:yes gene_type:complete
VKKLPEGIIGKIDTNMNITDESKKIFFSIKYSLIPIKMK